jgi:hypothetical protein
VLAGAEGDGEALDAQALLDGAVVGVQVEREVGRRVGPAGEEGGGAVSNADMPTVKAVSPSGRP